MRNKTANVNPVFYVALPPRAHLSTFINSDVTVSLSLACVSSHYRHFLTLSPQGGTPAYADIFLHLYRVAVRNEIGFNPVFLELGVEGEGGMKSIPRDQGFLKFNSIRTAHPFFPLLNPFFSGEEMRERFIYRNTWRQRLEIESKSFSHDYVNLLLNDLPILGLWFSFFYLCACVVVAPIRPLELV